MVRIRRPACKYTYIISSSYLTSTPTILTPLDSLRRCLYPSKRAGHLCLLPVQVGKKRKRKPAAPLRARPGRPCRKPLKPVLIKMPPPRKICPADTFHGTPTSAKMFVLCAIIIKISPS